MPDQEDGFKELRVRIEPAFYKKLLALKILRQKTMTEAIHEALEHYFSDVLPDAPRPRDARRATQDDAPLEPTR